MNHSANLYVLHSEFIGISVALAWWGIGFFDNELGSQIHSPSGSKADDSFLSYRVSASIKNSGWVSIGKKFIFVLGADEVLTGVCGYAFSPLDE